MMIMNQPKVSVIIPVYNVEKYLRQCLDSVLNQTLKEIEVICVDDGSTDSSFEILKEYEAKDSRVIVLQQQNKFAGVARNYGMSIAKGEYYVFLDSDDFFEPTLLEKQYNNCVTYNADIGLCGADRYDNVTGEFSTASWMLNSKLIPEEKPFNRHVLKENIYFVSTPCPWTKIFSAKFVKKFGLEYLPLPRSNDHYFVFSAISLADRIVALDEPLIHYRIGMSTNLQANIPKTPLTICESLSALKEKLDKEGVFDQVAHSFEKHVIEQIDFTLGRLNGYPEIQADFLEHMRKLCFEKLELLERITFVNPQKICSIIYKIRDIDREFAGKILVSYVKQNLDSQSVFRRTLGTEFYRDIINEYHETENFICEGELVPGNPGVSVIIPVYNAAEYIYECLDSITEQGFSNVEIVCVNDGSLDNSLEKLIEYQKQHGCVSIISKKNEGQSVARNKGVEFAKGEYILFVDSDDCLAPGSLRELYEYASQNSLDHLFFGADSFYEEEALEEEFDAWKTYYHISNNYDEPRPGYRLFCDLRSNVEFRVSPCMQLIKKSLLIDNNIQFIPGIIHEDNFFTFQVVMSAQSSARIDRNFYLRRVRKGSTMTSNVSFDNFYGYLRCYIELMQFAENINYIEEDVGVHIVSYIRSIGAAVLRDYRRLDECEIAKCNILTPVERYWFDMLSHYEIAEECTGVSHNDAQLVHDSLTFKIGAAVTYIPRKIYYVYRYFRQFGLKQTVQRIKNKLFN